MELQKKYGYIEFRPLKGHEPTLLDLQNCFCETDKFLRAKMPDLLVGNKRIKQKYKSQGDSIYYMFPPKWHVNSFHEHLMVSEPTLF